MSSNKRVAIVGAGVSGLATAISLVNEGFTNITIYEARREAGGRTRSYLDPTTGDILDNGQHLLMGCYTSTFRYLKSIGTRELLDWQPALSLPFHFSRGQIRTFRLPAVPAPFNILLGLLRTDLLNSEEKFAALKLGSAIRRNSLGKSLDDQSALDLFLELNQPQGIIQKLWEPIVLATLNASLESASAQLFVNVFRELFFSARSASAMVFPRVGLSELLVDPAVRLLQTKGIEIRLGSPVRKIDRSGVAYSLTIDDQVSEYDFVIWTAQTANGLPDELRPSLLDHTLSPIVNAYFWVDKPVLNSPVVACIGTSLQWIFLKSTVFSEQRLALTVSAADTLIHLSNEAIARILWQDVQSCVREARDANLVHYQVIKEKRATPLLTPAANVDRPEISTLLPNFYIAGDFPQNNLPATIEGAIRNGYSAASKVLRMLKG